MFLYAIGNIMQGILFIWNDVVCREIGNTGISLLGVFIAAVLMVAVYRFIIGPMIHGVSWASPGFDGPLHTLNKGIAAEKRSSGYKSNRSIHDSYEV